MRAIIKLPRSTPAPEDRGSMMRPRHTFLETGRLDRVAVPKLPSYVGIKPGSATLTMTDINRKQQTSVLKPESVKSKAAIEAERRASQRFTLVASADVLDLHSGMRISARVADLSLSGCYMDCLSPLPVGSNMRLRISCNSQTVELKATVRFSHASLGMGVGFAALTPDQLETIGQWMGAMDASRAVPAELATDEEHPIVKFTAPAASAAMASSKPRKCFEELFTLLVRKGILSESEMQQLLEKL
jgi:hypothetical protein